MDKNVHVLKKSSDGRNECKQLNYVFARVYGCFSGISVNLLVYLK